MTPLPDLLTVGEAAAHLRFSKRWVWQMLKDGRLAGRQFGGKRGQWRIPRSEVVRVAAGGEFEAQTENRAQSAA